jgi:acetolactate decarboxylase
MKKRTSLKLLICSCLVLITSCKESEKGISTLNERETQTVKSDTYYHYSIWWAFVNRVFDANLSVKTMKENGDVGLGSFNKLDGEMIMVDGTAYRVREDGSISEGKLNDTLVYVNAAFFQPDMEFTLSPKKSYDVERLKGQLVERMPSENFFYVYKIHGTFDYMKCGGVPKQEPPFDKGLDELIPNRPVFEDNNISGTIIGFYCPDFIGNINVKGFHFHFISDDKKLGGHVMDFTSTKDLTVGMDKKIDYHFVLPDNTDFENVRLDKEFQYETAAPK